MKEQLISFKTAKLAKERGFNWKTSQCYTAPNSKTGLLSALGHLRDWNKKSMVSVSAPTQSLLQRWLREEHNLYVMPIFNQGLSEQINCKVFKKTEGNLPEYLGAYKGFSSYEEALEEGLYGALNLKI